MKTRNEAVNSLSYGDRDTTGMYRTHCTLSTYNTHTQSHTPFTSPFVLLLMLVRAQRAEHALLLRMLKINRLTDYQLTGFQGKTGPEMPVRLTVP